MPDQARLHFVLSVLRDLNVELKSVNAVKSADPVLGDPGTRHEERFMTELARTSLPIPHRDHVGLITYDAGRHL